MTITLRGKNTKRNFKKFKQLSIKVQKAIKEAQIAREMAIAPFSNFMVGAVALAYNGRIYHGANIEEAAFNGCLHAEPCALGAANAAGNREIIALVICAENKSDPKAFTTPCQHCWQFICNYAQILGHPIELIYVHPTTGANLNDLVEIYSTYQPAPKVFGFTEVGIDLSKWRPKKP